MHLVVLPCLVLIFSQRQYLIKKMKAKEIFENQSKGILSQIQVLDIYFLNLLAIVREQELPKENITDIINAPLISGFNKFEILYKQEDFDYLRKNERVKYAGQQILLSTYTAMENYFIGKFREYFHHKLRNNDPSFTERLLKNISPRSLKDIKDNYSEYLNIHLPCFDVDYFTQSKCSFHPKDSWEGILLISNIRNDVAHKGSTEKYKITTLMDCWYPFEFVQNYVQHFEANFDDYFYNGRKTRLIKLYEEKVSNRI